MRAPPNPTAPGTVVILGGADVQAEAVQCARALGKEVHVLAAECGDAAREAATTVVRLDLTDVDAVAAHAERIGAQAVVSVGSDLAMPVVAAVSERLGLRSPVRPRTAFLCHHKSEVRRLLHSAPGAVAHAEARRGDGLTMPPPVIVKPDDGQGQRGLSLVTDEEGFPAALTHALAHSRTGQALVEEYVPGPEISVNGFLVDGRLVFAGVSDRVTWPGKLGLVRAHTFPSRVARPWDVQQAVEVLGTACERIELRDGPVYAQMIVGRAGVRLVEVTPRLDGCHLWRLWKVVTGVDLLAAAMATYCGEPLPAALTAGDPDLLPVPEPEDGSVVTIEFDCLPPGSRMPAVRPEPDPQVLDRASYYAQGAVVRTVNGQFEKVGWTLRTGRPGGSLPVRADAGVPVA